MTISDRGFYLDEQEKVGSVCEETIVDSILQLFDISTVVDFGCGAGRYTKQFIDRGVDCSGYDGNPLTPQMTDGVCGILDLTEPVDIGKFDLVFSLEVAEHIPIEYEGVFIDNLCNAAKEIIVLSWAPVGHEWPGHVNCQNNDYGIVKMAIKGFYFDKSSTEYIREGVVQWLHFKDSLMVFKRNNRKW